MRLSVAPTFVMVLTVVAFSTLHCGTDEAGSDGRDGGGSPDASSSEDDGSADPVDAGEVADARRSDGGARLDGGKDGSAPRDASPGDASPGDTSTTDAGDGGAICTNCVGAQHRIATGDYHSCALKNGQAYCWGKNDVGQLGNGAPQDSNVPVMATSPGVAFASIAAGFQNTCAVDVNGGVWCWGGGEVSGPAYNSIARTPASIAMPAAAATLAVGSRFACALLVDHRVACWGLNGWGQFGVALSGSKQPPTIMPLGADALALGAGEFFTCVITTAGTVCMGENSNGELGDGTLTGGWSIPRAVAGIGGTITRIGVGLFHTCAITSAGSAACWGSNPAGEVGPSGYDDNENPFPVPTLASAPTLVAAGGFHSCILTADGAIHCWGANYHGVLGRGTDTSEESIGPVTSAPSNVTELSLGRYHSCAWQEGVGAWCWGDNRQGQVGTGAGDAVKTPQLVGP